MGRLIAVASAMFILGVLFAFSIAPALATHDGYDDHYDDNPPRGEIDPDCPPDAPPGAECAPAEEKEAKEASNPCSPSFYQSAIDDVLEGWEAYF